MLDTLFKKSFFIDRIHAGAVGAHADGFAASLAHDGYADRSIRGALRATRALGEWLDRRGHTLSDLDEDVLATFNARATCAPATRRSGAPSVARFLTYLRGEGVVKAPVCASASEHPLVVRFADWMQTHRGARASTVAVYAPVARALLGAVRDEPARLTARRLRMFVLARASEHGPSHASTVVTASRMLVRFLVAEDLCPADLVAAVPAVATWRQSTLPRHLSAHDVERVIASCDLSKADGIRDRAVLLLLARLGLRASDVACLALDAIDWGGARFRVAGKSRREDWLPLPQDVGNSVLAYLKKARPKVRAKEVFFTARAPIVPMSRSVVATTVRRAIHRAGVKAPAHGAHVLRHSAAVAMLRAGSSLGEIGAVLRHASLETTFHYAKVDRDLLLEVAQPWPDAGDGARAVPRVDAMDVARITPSWPGVA